MALNEEQNVAVNHVAGPMMVLAGPGSGKTYTLVERIRHMIEDECINPLEILVITFSKKAALEMQERFEKNNNKFYPVTFGTFHAVFYNILKQHYNYDKDSLINVKTKQEYISQIAESLGYDDICNGLFIDETIRNISFFKSFSGTDEDKIIRLGLSEEESNVFIKIYNEYNKYLTVNRKIDFDDMLYKCLMHLKENRMALLQWRSIYKYFLVDEFQDINEIQYEVLMLLAGEEKNIFAVGDDDQSIYAFRGSNPLLMKKFIDDFNARVVNLSKNYRCAECIIESAKRLIINNKSRIEKVQTAEKMDKDNGNVYIENFLSEIDEAKYIISKIKEIIENKPNEKIAVLYRTTRNGDLIEEKLTMAGIPYERKEEKSNYYESDFVLDVLSYLKIAAGSRDRRDFFRILNKPNRGLSRECITDNPLEDNLYRYFSKYPKMRMNWIKMISQIDMLKKMNPYSAVNYIFKGMNYESYFRSMYVKKGYKDEIINEYIDELLDRAKAFESVNEWLSYINEYKKAERDMQSFDVKNGEDKKENKVILMTAHASKGLEFENVFIIALKEGCFPHSKAVTEEGVEEERRLMYVAMTRAKNDLYLCGNGSVEFGKKISRFLVELGFTNEVKKI